MALPPLRIRIEADATDAKAGLEQVNTAMQKTGAQARALGRSMASSTAHTANLAAQFNDIGVMLAAGQSPLMLAVQQGSQINQVFAQMGGGRAALRGLGAAFTSLINPMSLATIAIIAGGAALVQWGVSALTAGKEAGKLAEALEEARTKSLALNEELRRITLGASAEEIAFLDAIAQKRREIADIQGKLADADNRQSRNLRASLDLRTQELRVLEGELSSLQQIENRRETQLTLTRETAEAERLLGEQIQNAARAAAMQAYELQKARDAAMEAAREWMAVQELRSRFAGEEMVMSQDVLQVGRGDPVARQDRRGGGGARSDPRAAQMEALVSSLQTEREIVQAWYQESLDLLQNASEAELSALGGKHAAIERLEKEHQERLKGIRESGASTGVEMFQKYGGDILSAMGATGKQMALINAAIGASQALADPTIPFWGKFAAVAQVLSAGRSLATQAETGTPVGATAAAVAEPQIVRREVTVQLRGGDQIGQASIRNLIEQINDAIGDGAQLNVRA